MRICVFCGSSSGWDPVYVRAARDLGTFLAGNGIELVYGGGSVGLMGTLADAVMAAGGHAIGVIPRFLLEREIGHRNLSELVVVESMHERKALMAEKADAFAALPGGMGTFEELCEVLTWSQLGLHGRPKPTVLLDVKNYYAPLLQLFDRAVAEGFLKAEHRNLLVRAETPEELLACIRGFAPPVVDKWLNRGQE